MILHVFCLINLTLGEYRRICQIFPSHHARINTCNYLLKKISKNNRCEVCIEKYFLKGIIMFLLKMGFKKEGYYGV